MLADKNNEKIYNQVSEFLLSFFKAVWKYRVLIIILLLLFVPVMVQAKRPEKKFNSDDVDGAISLTSSKNEFFIHSAVMAVHEQHKLVEQEKQNALYVLELLRSKASMPYGFLPADLKTHEGEYAKTVLHLLDDNPATVQIELILSGLKRAINLGTRCFELYDFHKVPLEKIRSYARRLISSGEISAARQIFQQIIELENANFFLYKKKDLFELVRLSEKLQDKKAVVHYSEKIIEKFDFYSESALASLVFIYGETTSDYFNKEKFLNYGHDLAGLSLLRKAYSWQAKAYYYVVLASLSTDEEANEIARYALPFIESAMNKYAEKKYISDYLHDLKSYFLVEVLKKTETTTVTNELDQVLDGPRLKN